MTTLEFTIWYAIMAVAVGMLAYCFGFFDAKKTQLTDEEFRQWLKKKNR
jgi:uncharacterized membrane protein